MPDSASSPAPVPVLIVGGCGFIGYHITRLFLSSPSFGPVHVASRNPSTNLLSDAAYHSVDICSPASLHALLATTKPTVVIHCASPIPTTASAAAFQDVTINGTANILSAATASPSVQALVYTSSCTMAAGREHVNRREDAPLADEDPRAHPYARTKAVADRMVLAANTTPPPQAVSPEAVPPASPANPTNTSTTPKSEPTENHAGSLATASIRLPLVYGERDLQAVPATLAALEAGHTNFIVGPGDNLWEMCSVDNAARAHLLLASALLGLRAGGDHASLPVTDGSTSVTDSSLAVAGEAFNISDADRRPFWSFPREMWKAAGWDPGPDGTGTQKVWAVPTWLGLLIAGVVEWLYWIFTCGTRKPFHMSLQQVEYFCFEHTYCIEKARERLGFVPVKGFEEGMRRAVEWCLREDGWARRLEGRVKGGVKVKEV